MDKVKKYILYIVLLAVFALFSNLLIAAGLNSNYREISNKGENISQVNIYQSEATKVNGRIRGIIHIDEKEPIEEKYLKIDFFSERNINMGSKYIEIDKTQENMPFEAFFKLNNVSYYKMSLVNEKAPTGEIEFIPKDLNKGEIFFATLFAMLILW